MEKINFKIDLGIVTHDAVEEHPFVNISINGFPQFGEILNKDTVVEIDVEVEEDTENFLTIEYNNKDANVDVVYGENEIDNTINRIGFQATKLSWNGRTTLKFTTPIYIWLLENI